MSRQDDQSSPVQPLDHVWWETADPTEEWMPPGDAPILAPYEKSSPGFELLVKTSLEPGLAGGTFEDVGDGYFQVCLWDILHDIKNKWTSKTDPADGDEDKQKINQMQCALGPLDDDSRFIRLQIACFMRCFWTFPGNVDLILDGIASGKVNLDARLSCEPPWTSMREVLKRRRSGLRKHQQACDAGDDARRELMRAYMAILTCWCARGSLAHLKAELPDHVALAETIYRRLGEPATRKCLYVQKLWWVLGFWGFPSLAPHERRWNQLSEVMGAIDEAIRRELGDEKDAIGRLINRVSGDGSCHHAFFRRVDHIIAHMGAGRPVELPGAGQERKRIHDAVTNYVHALGSWLAGRTVAAAISIWPSSDATVRRVYEALGDSTPRKRWLVACLWKRLQETDAHCGRGALDEQPERFALSAVIMSCAADE